MDAKTVGKTVGNGSLYIIYHIIYDHIYIYRIIHIHIIL